MEGTELETVPRVVLALGSTRVQSDLESALGRAGYDVRVAPPAADLTEHLDLDRRLIVVLDDSDDWLRVVADLVACCPEARPVLLASMDGPEQFLAAVSAGVAGFCPPDAELDAVVRTIESVRESGVAIPRGLVSPLVEQVRHGRGHTVQTAAGLIDVTDREWEILQLLMQRRSTKEMAKTLFVSEGTVRSHVSALLHKLGAVDRDDAIALVERGHRR